MGYLKNHLSSEDKQELLGLIEDYRQGLLPLIVPLDPAQASPEPLSGARLGAPAGVPHPYPKEHAAQSRVDLAAGRLGRTQPDSGWVWMDGASVGKVFGLTAREWVGLRMIELQIAPGLWEWFAAWTH